MGCFYEEGTGTAPNLEQAKRWYHRAAEQGHDLALEKCRELGIIIDEQKG